MLELRKSVMHVRRKRGAHSGSCDENRSGGSIPKRPSRLCLVPASSGLMSFIGGPRKAFCTTKRIAQDYLRIYEQAIRRPLNRRLNISAIADGQLQEYVGWLLSSRRVPHRRISRLYPQ